MTGQPRDRYADSRSTSTEATMVMDELTVQGYRSPAVLPKTLDGWLALPEHETAICPRCDRPGYGYCEVWSCSDARGCGYRWRWPVMGLD